MRRNRKRAAVALLSVSLAALACAQAKTEEATAQAATTTAPMPQTDRMPMATFKNLLAKGEVVVIDVRSTEAYAEGHIPGALSMPEETLTAAVAEKLKRLGRPIATYCS